MNLPLPAVDSLADAVRWACVLEATAPKVGNVYPGKSFDNLCYADFIVAAEIASVELTRDGISLSRRMHQTVCNTIKEVGTNVNLGIVLLLGPLIEAAMQSSNATLQNRVATVLENLDGRDGQVIFDMIRIAGQASTGAKTQPEDAPQEDGDIDQIDGPVDIIEAMRSASERDQIAMQYANDYRELFDDVVSLVRTSIDECGDVLQGISTAHLRLLQRWPDSLIRRKNGLAVALQVQERVRLIDASDMDSVRDFDNWLRSNGNQRNPGTTADLIAAALFVLLIQNPKDFN